MLSVVRVLGLCLCLAWPAAAQELPDPVNVYVSDYADVLTAEDEAELTDMLTALRADPGVEMTVATIRRRSDLGDWIDIAALARALFNHWGVGDATRNDGVLLLVAVEDQEVRVALGRGYPPVWDNHAQKVIDNMMTPLFADGDYAGGVKAGVHGLETWLIQPFAAGISYEESESPPELWGGENWLDLIFFLLFGGVITGMALWDRRADIAALALPLRACPQCGARGLVETGEIMRPSVGEEGGMRQVTRSCPACGWSVTREIAIPGHNPAHDERRDSNGSDGFGGGSSSGGGATGRW